MVDSIKGMQGAPLIGNLSKPAGNAQGAGESFGDVLKDSIEKVNQLQTDADKAIEGMAKGEVKNVHETMIAIEKASLSFNMMVQVRNKLLAAYEEIMRTQV